MNGRATQSPLWWVLFSIYAAFLPNAPYLLTDILHLITVLYWLMREVTLGILLRIRTTIENKN
ncbi:MAG: DUF1361 domain-containing protein [Xenococcaceae cyanobacterium]